MDQRIQFIADYLREALSMTELCDLYGVSRKTGYKWIDRYLRHGPVGLEDCSRKPRVSPNQTPEDLVAAILRELGSEYFFGVRLGRRNNRSG
jgi:transposase-like protein